MCITIAAFILGACQTEGCSHALELEFEIHAIPTEVLLELEALPIRLDVVCRQRCLQAKLLCTQAVILDGVNHTLSIVGGHALNLIHGRRRQIVHHAMPTPDARRRQVWRALLVGEAQPAEHSRDTTQRESDDKVTHRLARHRKRKSNFGELFWQLRTRSAP